MQAIYYYALCIWVRSRNCGHLVTWFCYQLIAKPGNKTAAVPWPDPFNFLHLYYFVLVYHLIRCIKKQFGCQRFSPAECLNGSTLRWAKCSAFVFIHALRLSRLDKHNTLLVCAFPSLLQNSYLRSYMFRSNEIFHILTYYHGTIQCDVLLQIC